MERRARAVAGTGAALLLLLAACTPARPPTPDRSAATQGQPVTLPPTGGVFDYQLGGPSERVAEKGPVPTVVERDSSATALPGAYNICYVNGFQTQPDETEAWKQHSDLLAQDADGALLVDPEWPDEHILDPSTPWQREGILALVEPVIASCAERGFDAVEIDNLDTFERFASIDRSGAFALAADYVRVAHRHALAIGQKNAAGATQRARSIGFDFAVTEECGAFDECGEYREAYGEHVLQIEYPGSLQRSGKTFDEVCATPDRAPLTILRDVELVPVGQAGRRYEQC
ncbi:hypothetical protein DWB68_02710 [Galactobacter valiniphilus]|uniref:Glycoside-hydrolase family GH114 TIM-barrel domain-containing protein n=1 Tax=Galactobacter valiniphilus TaxID=2676122 RepID=A0A399JCF9_9MICC|nr:hypothetical protein DWB68_02710 [Galactobacter valiniphilus]